MRKLILLRLKTPFNMKNLFLITLIISTIINTQAQELFDLSRCISTSLERNYSIQVIRNREEIAANNLTRGNAGMLPIVTTTNRFGGTVNNTTQNLREGGSNISQGIHNTSGSAGVNLGMTIFRGFQVQTTYQKLNELKQMGELNTQMSVENLVARIASEYNYYIQQQILYKNLAYAVSLSRERARIDEQRYLLGAASKLQLLQSLVYLNADSSRFARQNEVLRASQIRLNELMAAEDIGAYIQVKDTLIQINEDLNYEELFNQTLDFNTSLQIASKNQVISELDYKIIESRSYPYATLSSGYNYSYSGFETGNTRNQHVRGMNYGLTIGMDIFDGYNRKREKSNALIELENRKVQYQEVEQEVKADLLTIYYAYQNNLALLRLEEQNLEVARENLEIALERYKLGSLAGLELREVQKSLLDAEERLILVKYQTKLAEISLLQISGRIMDYI
jgi:outer membrane protein, adhesin transport system